MVVDALAEEVPGAFQRHRARAEVLDGRLGTRPGGAPGPRIILAKPTSYMNLSGGPVAALCTFYSVPAERLLVVHDELDLPEHTLRLKRGGGDRKSGVKGERVNPRTKRINEEKGQQPQKRQEDAI